MPKKPRPPTRGFREEPASFAGAGDQYVAPLRATTEIGKDGRIVIPAAMREAMGVKDGSTLILLMNGESLEVFTAAAGLRRAQALVKKYSRSGRSMVDELLEDRRREAAEEEGA